VPLRHLFLHVRGALLYRAGRYEASAKVLQEAMRLHQGGGELHDWLFLALAEHCLGRTGAAKAAATKARSAQTAARPTAVWDGAEVALLAAELDAALPPAGKGEVRR
jgi:hypothetical protein